MDSHSTDHSGQGQGHGIHLPDPSAWPLIIGVASLLAGAALIWWSRDRSSDIAGPLLGVAVAAVLISAGGWAYEDGRMRRKAEQGHGPEPAAARFTQVLTFAIADGQLAAARASGTGLIPLIEAIDLHDLEGFQDLRITVSPAEIGPSQVLVETTWKGREGLEAYDATRQTFLDLLGQHPSQLVPGTVQVFDMEVVRDTKDTSFKFGLGAAASLLVSLAVGGFTVGAGLNLFASSSAGGGGGEAPAPADPYNVRATDNRFNAATLQAPPATEVTFTLTNRGVSKHNLNFLQAAGGAEIAKTGLIDGGGQTATVKFTTPAEGTYFFQCDVHPDQMKGSFVVKAGVPPPGGAAPAAATGIAATGTAAPGASATPTAKK